MKPLTWSGSWLTVLSDLCRWPRSHGPLSDATSWAFSWSAFVPHGYHRVHIVQRGEIQWMSMYPELQLRSNQFMRHLIVSADMKTMLGLFVSDRD